MRVIFDILWRIEAKRIKVGKYLIFEKIIVENKWSKSILLLNIAIDKNRKLWPLSVFDSPPVSIQSSSLLRVLNWKFLFLEVCTCLTLRIDEYDKHQAVLGGLSPTLDHALSFHPNEQGLKSWNMKSES